MLESMATLILVIVAVVLIILILAYGIFITFYPLSKTIKGGIDAMKEHADEKMVVKKQYGRSPTSQVRLSRKAKNISTQRRKGKTYNTEA